jgi:Pyruvate/2-oxoacid:ferredoxin oxidoreductase delta subunit
VATRKIVRIDDQKCDGCGACIPNCVEGALAIVDGKARLVKDSYCDGLGACLGVCPQGAITIEERDADAFGETAVAARASVSGHGAGMQPDETVAPVGAGHGAQGVPAPIPCATAPSDEPSGCPGMRTMTFDSPAPAKPVPASAVGASSPPASGSALGHWPVQLALLPAEAPFFQDTELVLMADCVAYALPDVHDRFLRGKALAIACPKLDDAALYVDKLAEILERNAIRGLVLVHMEVPCCGSIAWMALAAVARCGRAIPARDVTVSVRGEILSDELTVLEGRG